MVLVLRNEGDLLNIYVLVRTLRITLPGMKRRRGDIEIHCWLRRWPIAQLANFLGNVQNERNGEETLDRIRRLSKGLCLQEAPF